MKRLLTWTVLSLSLWALGAHAEPTRKNAAPSKSVDLDAAAKATAALYASMPAVQAPTPAAAPAAPLRPLKPVQAAAQPTRSSPLLPATAAPAPNMQNAQVHQAAGDVWSGAYQCERAEKVSLRPGLAADQVELQWKTQRWQMRRIDSHSGAMRLEDASARMVWIQLPNKSMLLDQRQGRRLLDECQHDVQVQTAAQMKTNPPPALFDTTGMGR